jgi:hypothetical protein
LTAINLVGCLAAIFCLYNCMDLYGSAYLGVMAISTASGCLCVCFITHFLGLTGFCWFAGVVRVRFKLSAPVKTGKE